MVKVYGIKNCTTVKNALAWLDENKIEYTFYDFKKDGVSEKDFKTWLKYYPWNILINQKSHTWKGLTEKERKIIKDDDSAIQIGIEKPSIIKRPVVVSGKKILLGFNKEEYKELFKK